MVLVVLPCSHAFNILTNNCFLTIQQNKLNYIHTLLLGVFKMEKLAGYTFIWFFLIAVIFAGSYFIKAII